eukprot:CAMPEP_0196654394 /NCGR_PEP_ID=MMETSP1086-20130531/4092_1 /TAXON_ID=77921 /ORGANISM="Cyanoptyche  gloeocystis , Strain SAG4.97" /LENGTH=339 /DNA_ID=CAMNT_0041986119 /DNA_START=67 /DNA_END=1086 /DNA_ORIENTATION=+
MTEFFKLWRSRNRVIADFFEDIRRAEGRRSTELKSSVLIQRIWRGFWVRKSLKKKHGKAVIIQRIFRGHLGRQKYARICKDQIMQERMSYFYQAATAVQRIFRGYYSRKYIHNYYLRKSYLASVMSKTSTVLQDIHATHEQQMLFDEETKKKRELEEFQSTISSLHHLLSTRTIPGVYNLSQQPVTAYSMPIERHLRQSFQHLCSMNPKTEQGGVACSTCFACYSKQASSRRRNDGTQTSSSSGERRRLSIQAQSPYDVVTETAREDKRTNDLNRIAGNFLPSGKAPQKPYVQSLASASPYQNHWSIRDENKNLRLSNKPFYTTLPKGRLFDPSPVSSR